MIARQAHHRLNAQRVNVSKGLNWRKYSQGKRNWSHSLKEPRVTHSNRTSSLHSLTTHQIVHPSEEFQLELANKIQTRKFSPQCQKRVQKQPMFLPPATTRLRVRIQVTQSEVEHSMQASSDRQKIILSNSRNKNLGKRIETKNRKTKNMKKKIKVRILTAAVFNQGLTYLKEREAT